MDRGATRLLQAVSIHQIPVIFSTLSAIITVIAGSTRNFLSSEKISNLKISREFGGIADQVRNDKLERSLEYLGDAGKAKLFALLAYT